MASTITQIGDKHEHDRVVAESGDTPTVIYVSNSSLPQCKAFTPQYEALAARFEMSREIRFSQLEFTNKTSMMFKFAPNQLPVLVLVQEGNWCRTLLSPTMQELERGVDELLKHCKPSKA